MLFSVSRKCEYALRAILTLALRRNDEAVSSHRIAADHSLPQRFLEVILSELRQGGFVESRRGNAGGYVLAKPASQILIGQIVSFIEGSRQEAQNGESDDALDSLWSRVDKAVTDVLYSTTLADLAKEQKQLNRAYIPNYAI